MTKQIPLSQGKFALVDDDDFDRVNQFKWYAGKHRDGQFYAMRHVNNGAIRTTAWMHREIMNAPDGIEVDHVNREDTLNNRKSNLRLATTRQNAWNRKKRRDANYYKGVSRCKALKTTPWYARISVNGKRITIGYFSTSEDAARAYDIAARLYFGAFARTNFSD